MKLNRWLPLALLCVVPLTVFAASPVRINEFMANNGSDFLDDFGNYSDWIELYNDSDAPVNLLNWSLTDDPDNVAQWKFPNVTIPARGYLVVIASGGNTNTAARMHTSFSLTEGGEFLGLFDNNGTAATVLDPDFPLQYLDVSYGYNSAGNLVYFSPATPGAENIGGLAEAVGDTKFSHNRGFYDAPFELSITTTSSGATIRYTTNGVAPTESTGLVYSSPIRIAGTTTVRAAAFRTGSVPSNVDTQTYIFLDDVVRQSPNGAPPPGWPATWGANVVDYGMDPEIVNNPEWSGTIKNDLKTLPSFSIVMDLDDLFSSSTGIYANPGQDGLAWERQCSLELIYPDDRDGFQANAGIRIRGGFSRSTDNPKHAFRFFFRGKYGDGKLRYPLFGAGGASEFDKFDLRTFQNYSWSFQGDGQGIFMRDQFSRDTQLEMGHPAERGDFYHLYINGQYWGVFNTCERPEAAYGETYFGGTEEDYDTIKVDQPAAYTITATDGNMNAWGTLYDLARSGLGSDADYQRVLGNNPDGTPNPAYPVYVELENLIDYMLLTFYGGNFDGPVSGVCNCVPNNWYGLRNRNIDSRMAFMFFAHDSEHTLLPWNVNIDRTGPFPAGDGDFARSNPHWVFKQMAANAEFRLKVADRVHKYFFNDGLLTPAQNRERLLRRKVQLERAVVGESARWGDAKRATPLTKSDWDAAVNAVLNDFLPTRSSIVLEQIRGDGLYPSIVAPSFSQHGGNVNPGFTFTMSAPAGTIYYTLDGSDPRLTGGAVSGKALTYSGPLTLNQNATVKARVSSGGAWSALNEATFNIIQTFRELLITEIMYNPPNFGGVDGEEFEFIEFKNVGTAELDLSGIRFTNGIQYVFPVGTRLAAGAFHVIVKNPLEFAKKYPTVRVDGVFTNNLANSGESLAVIHAAGAPIQQFTYDDQAPWPTTPDGDGFSLVVRANDINADYSTPAAWRASAALGGSPGGEDQLVNIPAVLINEILTHTDLPAVDAIELHNPTAASVDVSGWFLTDDQGTPKKFRIPDGTSIPANGYAVFDEGDFNGNPSAPASFSLGSGGDDVFLFSAAADGTLTGYSQGFTFKAAANGVSFGRYTNSVGEVLYPAQQSLTLGTVNSGPRVGPIVINEIGYDPNLGGDEFIEIKNITGSPVNLFDPEFATNTWRLSGVDYSFPANTVIPANGVIVVSGVEPSLFRQHANIPEQITVLGPFAGNLQSNGELIELLRPDGVDFETNNSVVTPVVPFVVVDSVRYGIQLPWPTNSSGTGNSIERIRATAFGNDPQNWRSSPGTPSPGLENDGNRLPVVNAGADQSHEAATFPFSVNLAGSATDDGFPSPPASLTYSWSRVSGPGLAQFLNPNQASTSVSFPSVGLYVLRLTVSDSEYTVTDEVTVTVTRPLQSQTLIATGATWKYLDDGSNQNTAWREVDFEDTLWDFGVAPLGYTYSNIVTTVSYGPNPDAKYPTTYFRHAFNLTDASSIAALEARVRRDDGAIVYLNGSEIFRSNMPEGPVSFTDYASSQIGSETNFYPFSVSPTMLRNGKNVIALELHQVSATSSDLALDFELIAQVSSDNQAPTANAGADITIQYPAAANLNGTVTDDGLPETPGFYTISWTMVSGPGSVSFANGNLAQSTATFSAPGTYVLRMSVTDGELSSSDDVQVTVTGSTDPFLVWKQQHFSAAELSNPSISGDDADPDSDTMPNAAEYIAGTAPKDGTSFLHVVNVGVDGDDFVLRFEAVGDKSYTLLGSDDPDTGIWVRVLDLSPQGTTETIDVLDPTPKRTPKRFYRIVTPQRPQN